MNIVHEENKDTTLIGCLRSLSGVSKGHSSAFVQALERYNLQLEVISIGTSLDNNLAIGQIKTRD